MSTRQGFALLASLGALVLGTFALLAWRLGPCLAVGAICLFQATGAACRLLAVLGVGSAAGVLGSGALLATVALPTSALLAMAQRWWRTRTLLRALRRRAVRSLPPALAAAAREVGLPGKVDLVDVAQPMAFAYGLLWPRVCLSTGLVGSLAPDELRAVLHHERLHQARRDPLALLVAHGLATALRWLPLASDLYEHLELSGEVEADAAAARTPEGRRALAGALAKLLGGPTEFNLAHRYALSGFSPTERRIDALLDANPCPPFPVPIRHLAPSLLVVLALFCLALL